MTEAPQPPTSPGSVLPTVMLVLTTLLWGLSFPLVKDWHAAAHLCPGREVVAGPTLIALRMFLALALLAALQPRLLRSTTRGELVAGSLIALVFFPAFCLQAIGAADTTPALSAFFTALGGAWVPLLSFLFWRHSVARLTLLGILVAVVGVMVLLLEPDFAFRLGRGDLLTIIGSLFFGLQIIVLDRLGKAHRPPHLSVGMFATTGILGLAAAILGTMFVGTGLGDWLAWDRTMLTDRAALLQLAGLVVLPTYLAFTWMNTYQPRVSAARAGLIYFLEPVFASVFSLYWAHDQLTWRLIVGGLLVLAGNLLVELPRWLRPHQRDASSAQRSLADRERGLENRSSDEARTGSSPTAL